MPSASTNSNSKNKLMKQASLGCGPPDSTAEIDAPTNNTETVGSIMNTSCKGGGEKSASVANPAANPNDNPMRQALITIEHKIRNLEKRKTKLESYRDIQANGKELSSDQKAAVAKYDAVMATLDFARDLSKQMLQFSKDAEKEQKKQARKDNIAKSQAETAKIREVLIIQNILTCFADDSVRADFLNGENGAIKLESSDVEALEQFCLDIQTRRPESSDDPSFVNVTQKVAEHFSMTIDGRPKQFGETTFENLRRIFNQIQESGYLDKIYLTGPTDVSNVVDCSEEDASVTGANVTESSGDVVTGNSTERALTSQVLEDNMEKLIITPEVDVSSNSRNTPIVNYTEISVNNVIDPTVVEQQAHNNMEQIEAMVMPITVQSAPVVNSQPNTAAPVPNFSTQGLPPQPNRQRSGTTTPVHVPPMFPPPQQTPPQLQQVVAPTASGIISTLPPQQSTTEQHRAAAVATVGEVLLPPPIHGGPPPPGAPYPLTTVRAVEQDFFKQHQQQQQQQKYVLQMRPLAEVIGPGSFYFLQDSELDSPDIVGGILNPNQGGVTNSNASNVVFENQIPNLLMHVGDVPMTGGAPRKQSKKLNPQPIPVQQVTQSLQGQVEQHRVNQHQQPQSQQQSTPQQQPIATQTFTNQSFPIVQPQPPIHHQRQEPTAAVNVDGVASVAVPGISKTPTLNNGSTRNTPTPVFQQQQPLSQSHPAQPKPFYASELVMGNVTIVGNKSSVSQQPLQQQPQQQPMMIMTRLATPQARLPIQQPQQSLSAANVTQPQQQQQQIMHVSNFGFDPIVASFGGYEQQLTAAVTQKAVPNIMQTPDEKTKKLSGPTETTAITETSVVGDWEATIKSHSVRSAVDSNNAVKAGVLANAIKHRGPTTLEPATNKWSTEMNALSGRGNTPPTATTVTPTAVAVTATSTGHHGNNASRKNDWSSTGSTGGGANFGSDAVSSHSDNSSSNHWSANQTQQHDNGSSSGTAGGYGRSGRGPNNFQRRNDDRRNERSSGGGGGGAGSNSYRGRANNSYGQPQQQNGSGRSGGNGGMYFRNNEGAQSGGANSYYQNGGGGNGGSGSGGLYTKDANNTGGGGSGSSGGSRYDNNYRGPRGGSGGSNQRNQGPPRTLGRNAGGNGNNGNSSGYINPRQTNRMSLGLEKN